MASSGVKSQSEAVRRGQITTGKRKKKRKASVWKREGVCVGGGGGGDRKSTRLNSSHSH